MICVKITKRTYTLWNITVYTVEANLYINKLIDGTQLANVFCDMLFFPPRAYTNRPLFVTTVAIICEFSKFARRDSSSFAFMLRFCVTVQ